MTPSTVLDLTEELRREDVDWSARNPAFSNQFPEWVRDIREGVYLSTYFNPSAAPVHDNNRKAKEVIPGGCGMLKYGKFENTGGRYDGALKRFRETFWHMRRGGSAEPQWLQHELLELVLVMDLSAYQCGSFSIARAVEPIWNGTINAWLKARGLLATGQKQRVESRVLTRKPPTISELQDLLGALEQGIATLCSTALAVDQGLGAALSPSAASID